MLTVSRPVGIFIALGVVIIGVYGYIQSQSDAGGRAELAKTPAKAAEKPTDYTDEDYSAKFDSPSQKGPLRNVFAPLLKNDAGGASDAGPVSKDILRVPANLAAGNPNWIFTGYAVINGVKTALLEDQTTHHSEFVNEGGSWKTTRIVRIGSGSIVFDDLVGGQVAVMRYDPFLAAKSAAKAGTDAGVKPVDPSPILNGAIGPGGPPVPGQPRIMRRGPIPGQTMIINGNTVSISQGG